MGGHPGGPETMNTTGAGSINFGPAQSRWEPAQSYPDPAVQTLDPRFDEIKPPMNSGLDRLATGFRWAEGPAWFGDGRYLLWSDIPSNRIMRWDEETGAVSVFRRPSNNANGNTRDRQGRLITCEHDARRVTRTEYDGSVWFTDPPFGILGHYEGHPAAPELPTNVYRVDPRTGRAAVATGDIP